MITRSKIFMDNEHMQLYRGKWKVSTCICVCMCLPNRLGLHMSLIASALPGLIMSAPIRKSFLLL